jgi:hypothetical protein
LSTSAAQEIVIVVVVVFDVGDSCDIVSGCSELCGVVT